MHFNALNLIHCISMQSIIIDIQYISVEIGDDNHSEAVNDESL